MDFRIPNCHIPEEIRQTFQRLIFNFVPGTHLTDFDHADIELNTLDRHDAVTVADSDSVDLTLTGQELSAEVKPAGGGVDLSEMRVESDGSVYLKSETNGLFYRVKVGGVDGSVSILVGQVGQSLTLTTFTPTVSSGIRIEDDGTVHLANPDNGLYYQIRAIGEYGQAAIQLQQTGIAPSGQYRFFPGGDLKIESDGRVYLKNVTSGEFHRIRMIGVDGSASIQIENSPILPVGSKLRITANGDVYLQNSTNGLFYKLDIFGFDGSVSLLIDEIGIVL